MPDAGLFLAIDTSGADAGVLLAGADGVRSQLLPLDGPFARTEDLDAHVARLLADSGASATDIGAVAAVVGPGSYTGLRSGLAFLRGIGFGRSLPAVPIGSLELAAWRGASAGKTASVIWPTGKGSSIVGVFRRHEDDVEAISGIETIEDAALAGHLASLVRTCGQGAVVSAFHESRGDGAGLADSLAKAGIDVHVARDPGLAKLAALVAWRLRAGRTVAIGELLPVYVGLSVRPSANARATSAHGNLARAVTSAE